MCVRVWVVCVCVCACARVCVRVCVPCARPWGYTACSAVCTVCVCVCVSCMCICVRARARICVCACALRKSVRVYCMFCCMHCMHVCVCVCARCMWMRMGVASVCVCACVCMCAYACVCMCVCVYVCVCAHLHVIHSRDPSRVSLHTVHILRELRVAYLALHLRIPPPSRFLKSQFDSYSIRYFRSQVASWEFLPFWRERATAHTTAFKICQKSAPQVIICSTFHGELPSIKKNHAFFEREMPKKKIIELRLWENSQNFLELSLWENCVLAMKEKYL